MEFTEAIKEYGRAKGVLCFTFVQINLNSATEISQTLEQLQRKQGPLDMTQLTQSERQTILARIRTKLPQDQ